MTLNDDRGRDQAMRLAKMAMLQGKLAAMLRILREFGRSLPAARQLLVVAATLALGATLTHEREPHQWIVLGALFIGLVMLVKVVSSAPARVRRLAATLLVVSAAPAGLVPSRVQGMNDSCQRDQPDLRPRDMIDLQSFIWMTGSDESDRGGAAVL